MRRKSNMLVLFIYTQRLSKLWVEKVWSGINNMCEIVYIQ